MYGNFSQNITRSKMERLKPPTLEKWLVKMMEFAVMAKPTFLIREKSVSIFMVDWTVNILHETEKMHSWFVF